MGFASKVAKILTVDMTGDKKYWSIREKYEKALKKHKWLRMYYRNKWRRLMVRFNSFIPLDVDLARDVVFPHGIGGIYISHGAVIGRGSIIFQHVTIGSNTLEDSRSHGAPIIGDGVLIGAGATIIGSCRIGNNCRIGANATVWKDVPESATVVVDGVRVIEHPESRTNRFKSWNSYDQHLS